MSVHGAKLFTLILAGACALLLLLALLLQFGFGRGYSWLDPDPERDNALAAVAIDREPFKLPPEDSFAVTDARPIFNEDRKPTPIGPDDPITPPPPTVALNVALTGVILTPELHMAMIQDKAKNNSISLKEGMPMPGDQGGWTLAEVKQRSAIFKEMSGDEVEVELTMAVASPKPGSAASKAGGPPAKAGAPATAQAGARTGAPPPPVQPGQSNPQAAEQLQRRIEERRKQMRDEAERLKKQQNPAQN